jgi:phosphate/sulfate permease
MEKRPLSLTIIGWLLVVTGLFGLYSSLTIGSNEVAMRMIEDMGVSLRFHQALGIVGCIIALACAYGVFKGLPWSRVLYVCWGVISLVIGVFTSPIPSALIVGAIVLAVFAYFLFRPAADRWFAAKGLQLQRADG